MYRQSPRIFLALIAFTIAIPTISNAKTDAFSLVRLMEVDKGALIGMELSIRDGIRGGKKLQKKLECVSNSSPDKLATALAKIVDLHLSASEVEASYAFYQSDVGKKLTSYGIVQLYRQYHFSPPIDDPNISAADERAVAEFMATDAGRKLLKEGLFTSPEAQSAVNVEVRRIYNACPL